MGKTRAAVSSTEESLKWEKGYVGHVLCFLFFVYSWRAGRDIPNSAKHLLLGLCSETTPGGVQVIIWSARN